MAALRKKNSTGKSKKITNANTLETLSKSCREKYLTEESYWETAVDTSESGRLGVADPLKMRGVKHAAISVHRSGYYCEHSRINFNSVLFTIDGECHTSNGSDTPLRLTAGSLCFTPARTAYLKHKVNRKWEVLWFHIEDTLVWRRFFPKTVILKKSRRFKDIVKTAKMYFREKSSAHPSPEILEAGASFLMAYVRGEFLKASVKLSEALERIFSDAEIGRGKYRTAKSAARELGVSLYALNDECAKLRAANFSKIIKDIRMCRAKRILRESKDIEYSSKKSGFANRNSFTKAYSKFYGVSPARALMEL